MFRVLDQNNVSSESHKCVCYTPGASYFIYGRPVLSYFVKFLLVFSILFIKADYPNVWCCDLHLQRFPGFSYIHQFFISCYQCERFDSDWCAVLFCYVIVTTFAIRNLVYESGHGSILFIFIYSQHLGTEEEGEEEG